MAKESRQELLRQRIANIVSMGRKAQLSIRSDPQAIWDAEALAIFNGIGRSVLHDLYGPDHFQTKDFEATLESRHPDDLETRIGVIRAVGFDLEHGWYGSTSALIAGELFRDFLDMAEHLHAEGYKDAAAVIAGSSLESHLRRLCHTNRIDIQTPKGDIKKATLLNEELHKAGAYALNEQKQVTAWLGIRNDAAHGAYDRYLAGQVQLMIDGIRHFIMTRQA